MLKYVLSAVAALVVAGAGYAVAGHEGHGDSQKAGCCTAEMAEKCTPEQAASCPMMGKVATLSDKPTASAPAATAPAEKAVNVGNTKCAVMGDDIESAKHPTVTYNGKEYNLCCKDCIAEFKKDPEKYVKAIEADPAKYGVKKADTK